MPVLLRIGSTWDGVAVADDEIANVRVEGRDPLVVTVDAPYHGDAAPPGPPGPLDGLWDFEVVELFVAGADGYVEIELGPHGHHLVLLLTGVRQARARALPMAYAAAIAGARWRGVAEVPRAWLPAPPWRVNAFALHGDRRYLAATPLPGPRPDFHQPDRFPPLEDL